MKLVSANVDYMQVFVTLNKDGMKINADLNEKNWLTKEYLIKSLSEIVNVNVINYVMSENI